MGGNLTFNDNDDVQLKGATDATLIGNVGDSLKVAVTQSTLPTGAATTANQAADQVLIGAVTETAPASDTASSGLNGRLQRIAQRLTSLLALLPTSLGQKTMANSLAVTVASDQSAIPVSLLDTAPATQSITVFDTGTISFVGANGQTFYSGTPTANSTATFNLASVNTVDIQASLIGAGGTMVVEVSMDGGTFWVRPVVFQPGTQSYSTAGFTSPFLATVNVTSMTQIRVRGTVSWTGVATILIRESVNTKPVIVSDALPPGANTIGSISNVSGIVSLPTGASTSANQSTEITALQLIDNPVGSVAAGTAGTSSYLTGGIYNTALPTMTNGQQVATQLDSSGRMIIAPLANTSVVKAQLQDNAGNALGSLGTQLLDADLLNVAGQFRAQNATTSATEALGAGTILANRKFLSITPTAGTVYWGTANTVTTSTGTPIFKNQTLTLAVGAAQHIYIIAGSTLDCRIVEMS